MRHLGRRLRRVRPPRGIGYLPQNPEELLHGESVAAEIGPWMRGCPALLALLGLDLPADLDPLRASHGQRLALAIAAVLAPLPPVLLLDDPAAWLDPAGEERLFATLDHLQAAHGLAVVVASHDRDLLARTCGRLVVLPASRPVRRDTSTGPGPGSRRASAGSATRPRCCCPWCCASSPWPRPRPTGLALDVALVAGADPCRHTWRGALAGALAGLLKLAVSLGWAALVGQPLAWLAAKAAVVGPVHAVSGAVGGVAAAALVGRLRRAGLAPEARA